MVQRAGCMQSMVIAIHWLVAEIFLTTLSPGYMARNDLDGCLNFFCNDLLANLEVIMFGISAIPEGAKVLKESRVGVSSTNMAEELKMFGKECKCRCYSDVTVSAYSF